MTQQHAPPTDDRLSLAPPYTPTAAHDLDNMNRGNPPVATPLAHALCPTKTQHTRPQS